MAEPPYIVHKFRATGDAWSNGTNNKVIKRNRQPLSCLPCRQRKLKCNRQQPCELCVKRNDESACLYTTKSSPQKSDSKPQTSRAKAQDRLRQLEELVMQMVDSNQQPVPASALTPVSDPASPAEGVLSQQGDSSRYVGSTHWSAILENIQELKTTLSDDSPASIFLDTAEDLDPRDGDVLFGAQHTIPLPQILSQYLPPRLRVDRLMSFYFNANYMTIPHIHAHQFQKQYEQFWRDPLAVTPHWASMLFSICCLGSKLSEVSRDSIPTMPGTDDSGENFLKAAAQCILLGGYRPCRFVIESLALYAQCRYLQSMDPSREVGLVFAIIVRLAYRMAYHRDPDNFSHFTPFESEMRRRVWAMTRQFDLMSSFQLGLPPNVAPDSWDTKLPRNLLDSDFEEDTPVLPPSRPESQPTKILYFIVKARLMGNFSKICSHALSFKNSSQAEIMELDASIRATYDGVPDTLRVRPMSQSFADPPYLIMVRINCEFLYQKSLVVLHRKYMTQGYDNSTRACIAAARSIVTCFADLHKEFKPGGQVHHERWMLGSFTMNDFLLAAMVLCLATSQWHKTHPRQDIREDAEANEWLQMLTTSHDICVEMAATSNESRKVAGALQAMLLQLQPDISLAALPGIDPTQSVTSYQASGVHQQSGHSYPVATQQTHTDSQSNTIPLSSEYSTAASSFPLSTSAFFPTPSSPHHQQQPQASQYAPVPFPNPTNPDTPNTLNNLFYPFLSTTEPPTDIDWTAIDTFFVNSETYNSSGSPAVNYPPPHPSVTTTTTANNDDDDDDEDDVSGGGGNMGVEVGATNLLLPFSGLLNFSYDQAPTPLPPQTLQTEEKYAREQVKN